MEDRIQLSQKEAYRNYADGVSLAGVVTICH